MTDTPNRCPEGERVERAKALSGKGMRQVDIAAKLRVSQATVSRWVNPPPPLHVAPDHAALSLGVLLDNSEPFFPREAPSWADARERAKARHRKVARRQPNQRVSLDAATDEWRMAESIADPSSLGQDPYVVLFEEGIGDLLGDLAIEDVARMDESELASLRQRLVEAGVAPSSVQHRERERLRDPVSHRGQGSDSHRGKKQSRHRGRKEASTLMRSRGAKFKRVDRERNGWGGVVLPDEEARP